MRNTFPWHIVHPKNRQTFSERLADLAQWQSCRSLTPLEPQGYRSATDWQYLTLACSRDFALTYCSLRSLLNSSPRIPPLTIACDDSLEIATVQRMFDSWPQDVTVWSQTNTIQYFQKRGRADVASFCQKHIFGYKLATAVRAAERAPVLYSDADVLWFDDVEKLIDATQEVPIAATSDLGRSYDSVALSLLPSRLRAALLSQAGICAGVFFMSQPWLNNELLSNLLNSLHSKAISRFTEQTIVAAITSEHGITLPMSQITMLERGHADRLCRHLHSQPIGCHYPDSHRPQFWLDYRRIGRVKSPAALSFKKQDQFQESET